MLLSAVLPDNIEDYLQVHISLPQTRSQTSGPTIATTVTSTVATATPAAKTTRATRKKRKTSPTATEISPTATETPMPAPPHPRRPQSTLQNEGIDALAQIDAGCQVGDVINRRVLRDLRGEPHLRPTDTPLWMCSGLNNQCIESTRVLDIIVSFKKNSFQHTFSLPVRIAEDSKVDLILGLQTIEKLNLVKLIPEFF